MKKRILCGTLALLLICSLCACSLPVNLPDGNLGSEPAAAAMDGSTMQVSFFDVGQGDCELIVLPDGKTILIDAGESKSANDIISFLEEKGVSRLDYVIATHPHADHIGGMQKVIEAFDVGEIYMPKVEHDTKTYENLLLTIQEKGLRIHTAKEGVSLIDEGGVSAQFVAPCSDSYKDLNNYSAVLRLTYGDVSFLFMGDAEQESEDQITADVSADIIKLGHHGSSTSSSQAFLEAVSPSAAIISCGKDNSYGHPHEETLQTLDRLGVESYRTDQDGTVTVTTDGTAYRIETAKSKKTGSIALMPPVFHNSLTLRNFPFCHAPHCKQNAKQQDCANQQAQPSVCRKAGHNITGKRTPRH